MHRTRIDRPARIMLSPRAFLQRWRKDTAVMDTGCQRSAIGLNTLHQLQKFLPSDLPIKFLNRKFRFAGIGGETVTNRVALLPVCFGRRPGVVHAAVLEDTPDAPFLLSLPILKALESQVHLARSTLQYHAIGEEGNMFYNSRGQLCLRLFDFQAVPANQPSNRWKPKKIIGDECQVFMLQSEASDEPSKMGSVSFSVQLNEPSAQLFNGDKSNDEDKYKLIDVGNNQKDYQGNNQSKSSMPNHTHPTEAGVASSIAETHHSSDRTVPSDRHGGHVGATWKQESLHQPPGCQAQVRGHMVTHDQQDPDPAPCGDGAQGADQSLSAPDLNPQAGTGNDDARGRDRRDGVSSGYDGEHDPREEAHGERSKLQEVPEGQQCLQLRTGIREFGSQLDGGSKVTHLESQRSRFQQFQPNGRISTSSRSSMFLRSGASVADLPEGRDELHEKVLSMSQESERWEPVPVLPVDREHQGRGVRKDLQSKCFFQQVQEVQEHKEAVREHLRKRIQRMRSQRQGLEGISQKSPIHTEQGDIHGRSSQLRSPVESSRNERSTKYEDVPSMRPRREDSLPRRQAHPTMDRCEHSEEVGPTTGIQPIELKSGCRKRIIGDIQAKLDALENEQTSSSDSVIFHPM